MNSKLLELLANEAIMNGMHGAKPNLSDEDFRNVLLITNHALGDKMYNLQDDENMSLDSRMKMAENLGTDFRKLIKIYTNIDTHELFKPKLNGK